MTFSAITPNMNNFFYGNINSTFNISFSSPCYNVGSYVPMLNFSLFKPPAMSSFNPQGCWMPLFNFNMQSSPFLGNTGWYSNNWLNSSPMQFSQLPYSSTFSAMPRMQIESPKLSLPILSNKSKSQKVSTTTGDGNLKLDGYNSSKGERLASDILSHSVGFDGDCALYVSNALERTSLFNGRRGHAYQMLDILEDNNNFRKLSSTDVDLKSLPAGCILVYGKGVGGYSSLYGHVEVTTGDGRAVSDGITQNLHKKPSAIFIPV